MVSRKSTVSAAENATSRAKLWARMDSACFFLPAPMRIAIRMEPPMPISVPKEVSKVTIGPHTPTPARAVSPIPGMFPMNMRSMML